MKIIEFLITDNSPDADKGRYRVIADSALSKDNRPFFVPDINAPYHAIPALIFPVTRLGKSIAPRFMSRYIGEPHAAFLFEAQGCPESSPAHYSFDGSVHCGGPLHSSEATWHLGQESVTISSSPLLDSLYEEIARFSRLNTLRMGDYFLLPLHRFDTAVTPDTSASVRDDEGEILKFNIK